MPRLCRTSIKSIAQARCAAIRRRSCGEVPPSPTMITAPKCDKGMNYESLSTKNMRWERVGYQTLPVNRNPLHRFRQLLSADCPKLRHDWLKEPIVASFTPIEDIHRATLRIIKHKEVVPQEFHLVDGFIFVHGR